MAGANPLKQFMTGFSVELAAGVNVLGVWNWSEMNVLTGIREGDLFTAGGVDVGVTVPGQTEVVKAGGYTYTLPKGKVTGVNPAEGLTAGGTTVKITGDQFAKEVSVQFGDEPATAVTFIDATTVEAITPRQQQPGTVDVRIDAGADLIGIAPSAFTYKR